MSSTKTEDYDVEKIVSKRINGKGRIYYLIKWKGYSTAYNTWEPKDHVANCQDLIKEFEAGEEENRKKLRSANPNESQGQINVRSTRSSVLTPKQSTNKGERSTRSSNRSLPTRQHNKRAANHDDMVSEGENDNESIERKSASPKRLRKNTNDTDLALSIDSDVLDTSKLDQILDVRRNKKTNMVEYYIQVKKVKKPIWMNSYRLAEDYHQQVIDFLEEQFV